MEGPKTIGSHNKMLVENFSPCYNLPMGFFPTQRSCSIFVVYLALSVMGGFAFAAAEDLTAFDFWKSEPMAEGTIISTDADYTIGCFAEYTVKARGYSSLPSRKSMRIVTFFGTLYAGIITLYSGIKIAKLLEASNNKNTLLFKLRL